MKKRIRNGQYEFPDAEWSRVTQDGKLFYGFQDFILRMLSSPHLSAR